MRKSPQPAFPQVRGPFSTWWQVKDSNLRSFRDGFTVPMLQARDQRKRLTRNNFRAYSPQTAAVGRGQPDTSGRSAGGCLVCATDQTDAPTSSTARWRAANPPTGAAPRPPKPPTSPAGPIPPRAHRLRMRSLRTTTPRRTMVPRLPTTRPTHRTRRARPRLQRA